MKKQHLVCITGGQRSGTTALQHALKAAGLMSFSEIFHTTPLEQNPGSFLAFARESDLRLTHLLSRAEAGAMADRYLDWLRELAASKHLVFDIKLNSWSVLSPWWQFPHQEPFFLTHLKRNHAIVILLWREALADQVISEFIAREFGIWHNLTIEKVAGRTLQAPVEKLKEFAGWIARAEIDLLEHLAPYQSRIVLPYEQLFEDSDLSPFFREAFHQVSSIKLPEQKLVRVRQNSASKQAIVTNYIDVVKAIEPIARWRKAEMNKGVGRSGSN